jgi:hypothetical protein
MYKLCVYAGLFLYGYYLGYSDNKPQLREPLHLPYRYKDPKNIEKSKLITKDIFNTIDNLCKILHKITTETTHDTDHKETIWSPERSSDLCEAQLRPSLSKPKACDCEVDLESTSIFKTLHLSLCTVSLNTKCIKVNEYLHLFETVHSVEKYCTDPMLQDFRYTFKKLYDETYEDFAV